MAGKFESKRLRNAVVSLLCWLAVAGLVEAAPPLLVGDSVRPTRFQITGANAFPAEQVLKALANDVDLLPVLRRDALLENLLSTIDRRLTSSYHALGFADAEVTARWNEESGQVDIQIEEGPRYRWNTVQVRGVPEAVQESIRQVLIDGVAGGETGTAGNAQEIEGVVTVGKWIKQPIPASARVLVERGLALHALTNSRFEIEIDRHPQMGAADLVVNVVEPGPLATISRIEVLGCEHQSASEILSRIGIAPGDAGTATAMEMARRRLWETGRFRSCQVFLESSLIPSTSRVLIIQVEEWTGAPRLESPLDEIQQAAVRAAHWINTAPLRGMDVVLRAESGGSTEDSLSRWLPATVIISRTDGLSLHCDGSLPKTALGSSLSCLVTKESIQTILLDIQQGMEIPVPLETGFQANIRIDGTAGVVKEGKETSFSFGFGFSSKPHQIGSILLDLSVSPMAALREVESRREFLKLTESELIYEERDSRLVIESATGRIKECRLVTDQIRLSLHFETDRQRELKETWLPGVAMRTLDRSVRLGEVVSVAGHLLSQFPDAESKPERKRWRAAIDLAQRYVNEVQDPELRIPASKTGDRFRMAPSETCQEALQFMNQVTDVFPADSELGRLCRDLKTAVVMQDRSLVFRSLTQIQNSGAGGVTHLLMAATMKLVVPQLADVLARQGLTLLGEQPFRTDLRLLQEAFPEQSAEVIRLGHFLRGNGAVELREILDGVITPEELRELAERAQDVERSDQQFSEFLLILLWRHGGRDGVEELLLRTRLPSPAAVAAAPAAVPVRRE